MRRNDKVKVLFCIVTLCRNEKLLQELFSSSGEMTTMGVLSECSVSSLCRTQQSLHKGIPTSSSDD